MDKHHKHVWLWPRALGVHTHSHSQADLQGSPKSEEFEDTRMGIRANSQ